MEQLLLHLWGDYILQSDWMAQNKTKDSIAAFANALAYSAAFLLLRPSLAAWLIILVTHFFIDRYRLSRYVVWAKNWIAPKSGFYPPKWHGQEQRSEQRRYWEWESCKDSGGYPPDCPAFMWIWLLIAADNTLHLTINYLALRYL